MSEKKEAVREARHAVADENGGSRSALGGVVDYKTLFLGSCTLIVGICSVAFGIWDRGAKQTAENNRASIDNQWERISKLEENDRRQEFDLWKLKDENGQLKSLTESQAKAIRELEQFKLLYERRH